jgi:hypothetical protein
VYPFLQQRLEATEEATSTGELWLLALHVLVHGKRGEEGYEVRQNKGKVKDSKGEALTH